MKSILIPTDYSEDTLHAMELTWRNSNREQVKVVLLQLSALPDSESQLLFLANGDESDLNSEQRLLEEWEIRKSLLEISIEVIQHHQYGASVPIIRQIIEQHGITSVIVPFSIRDTNEEVYQEAMQSFRTLDCKITLMPERQTTFSLE